MTETIDLLKRVWDLTNNERRQHQLPDLTFNWELAWAAMKHSANMANQDFFDHRDLENRVRSEGYQGSVGENIYAGGSTAEAVVNGWMDSPGHRDNILNPQYREIGVGYFFLENDPGSLNYRYYWTQIFGIPR
ncbi:CAP domain-containing protein (plasmid) [Tolypothrix sp. PCC 7910]|uniref:CAP domain-containing protein n=1 Tax=Tolypothrix sp. PCC 7910 TaxID=2099387 RepID=UPI0014278729|nr:CAP domain-containing protein [Tolypothrix sp. PCC 7910]QIR41927.1 CAP domain-containing protein [Tolypothrix sp. PCC 7910]